MHGLFIACLSLCAVSVSSTSDAHISLEGCGKTKGCFRSPPGCHKDQCRHIVTWKVDKDQVEFELDAKLKKDELGQNPWCWTAVGLSYDQDMKNTSVIDCILNATDHSLIIQSSYNDADKPQNTVLNQTQLGLNTTHSNGKFADDHLFCNFRRNRTVDPSNKEASKVFSLSDDDKYYLLLPVGPATDDGVKQKHFDAPAVTPVSISVTDMLDIGGHGGNSTINISMETCGTDKGCFRDPTGCKMDDCKHIATWKEKENTVEFELLTNIPYDNDNDWPWTAIGFSPEGKMANSSVIACIVEEDGNIVLEASFNPGYFNQPLQNKQLGILSQGNESAYQDGRLLCKFIREKTVDKTTAESEKVYDLCHSYYFLLASGQANKTGFKQKHTEHPSVSPCSINVKDNKNIGAPKGLKIETESCGKKKGCWHIPPNCEVAECEYLSTWRTIDDNTVELELVSTINTQYPWVAIGFNDKETMDNTSVLACVLNATEDKMVAEASFNTGHSNNLLKNSQLGIVPGSLEGSYIDGQLRCKIQRYKEVNATEADHDKVYNLHNKYYFILATGPADKDGVKHKHTKVPCISAEKLDVSQKADIGGMKAYPLVQAHATLMILAWVICACLGTFVARNMKTYGSSDSMLWGKARWFQFHRMMMCFAFMLAILGLSVILKETNFVVNWNLLHPIMGIVTLALAALNPIIAVFRPDQNSSRRPIFYWAHFICGNGVILFSFISIYLGVQLEKANMADWSKWVVVGYLVFRDVIEISLTIIRRMLKPGTYHELTPDFSAKDDRLDRIVFGHLIVYAIGLSILAAVLIFNVFT